MYKVLRLSKVKTKFGDHVIVESTDFHSCLAAHYSKISADIIYKINEMDDLNFSIKFDDNRFTQLTFNTQNE